MSEGNVSLDYLLRTHRRLALSQSPLEDRLKVLRQLYRSDPNPDFWKDDLREYESARIHELESQAKRAKKQNRPAMLESILAELKSKDWIIKSPTHSFVSFVEKSVQPHRNQSAGARYLALSETIRDAHGAMDEATCRTLIDQWASVEAETGIAPPADCAQQVAAVRSWLDELQSLRDEEDAFNEACDALEEAIDENKELGLLEKLAATILRFDRGMPELLAARFSSRSQELKRLARRKFTFALTSTVVGLLLMAAGIATLLVWRGRVQEREGWHAQILKALDANKLDMAGDLIKSLEASKPQLLNAPQISDLHSRYRQMVSDEAKREARFKATIAALTEAWSHSQDIAAARKQLEKAEADARTYDEKNLVEDWRQNIQTYEAAQIAKLEKYYEEKLKNLQIAYDDFNEAQNQSSKHVNYLADKCLAAAAELTQAKDVPPSIRAKAEAIEGATRRVSRQYANQLAQARRAQQALLAIRNSSQDSSGLAKLLRDFSTEHPTHPLAKDFVRAAKMELQWQGVLEWNVMVLGWKHSAEVSEDKTAEVRLVALNKFLNSFPNSAYHSPANFYKAYLEKAKQVLSDGLPGLTTTRTMFSGRLFDTMLHSVRTNDGKRYYYLAQRIEKPFPDTGRIDYMLNRRLDTRSINLLPDNLAQKADQAPHVAFGSDALKLIRGYKGDGWATLYLRLAEKARIQRDVDGILQASLVKMFLRQARMCTPWHVDQIDKVLSRMDKEVPDFRLDVEWINPNDEDAKRFRTPARNAVAGLDSFKQIIDNIETEIKRLPSLVRSHAPVGVLLDRQELSNLSLGRADGDLFVIIPSGQRSHALLQIGSIREGKPTINQNTIRTVPLGSIVFILE
jgi:hypothetical protein